MRTYRNLYPQIWDFANLYLAYRAARKGKRGKVTVATFVSQLSPLLASNVCRSRLWPAAAV